MRRRLRRLPVKLRAPWSPSTRPRRRPKHVAWSFLSALCGVLAIAGIAALTRQSLLIGSFGASAVLLYGAPDSPFSQPRNVLGGHVLSAVVGCGIASFLPVGPWAMGLAVGLALAVMQLTHTTHPPGGATALIALSGGAGWGFVLSPVAAGAVILVAVAVVSNNVAHHRRYPQHWW